MIGVATPTKPVRKAGPHGFAVYVYLAGLEVETDVRNQAFVNNNCLDEKQKKSEALENSKAEAKLQANIAAVEQKKQPNRQPKLQPTLQILLQSKTLIPRMPNQISRQKLNQNLRLMRH